MENYIICLLFNGLSDHNAQRTVFNTTNLESQNHQIQTIRKINKHTITDFLIKLSYETWDTTFSSNDVNIMFNSFLNEYLRILYSSFPLKVCKTTKSNDWITIAVNTSCKHKKELDLASTNSNNSEFKYYQQYCKIMSPLIKVAKKFNYNNKIQKSSTINKSV